MVENTYKESQFRFAVISIFLGQNYDTLWTVCVMGIFWIF